jgi:hypothetical protein
MTPQLPPHPEVRAERRASKDPATMTFLTLNSKKHRSLTRESRPKIQARFVPP